MVDFLPEAVFRTDANLRLTYVNLVAIEMLGASPSDLDKAPSLLDFIDQADHARVMHLVGELGLGMRPFPVVVRARRSDGTALFIEAVAAPIFDADGGVGGLWGAGRDVTLRVRTEELAAIMNGIRRSLASTSDLQEALEQVLDATLLLDGVEAGCVYVAASGDEAVQIVQAAKDAGEHFDLVIMDLTMPGSLGGTQATAALLQIDPEMKVVVSSGYSDDPAVAEYGKYGFAAALQKPYTLDALRATLERIL